MQNYGFNNQASAATAQASSLDPKLLFTDKDRSPSEAAVTDTVQSKLSTDPITAIAGKEPNCNNSPPISKPKSINNARSPYQATIAHTDQSKPSTDPIIVVAGKEIELSHSNRDHIAKLPVSFGFFLDDDGTSKALALAATERWYKNGKDAAIRTKLMGTKNATRKGKHRSSSNNDATPSANNAKSTLSGAPPKTAAALISTSESPPGLPAGWTSKTYQRTSGVSSGSTDTYWFSPHLKTRFRSIKGCVNFIKILSEAGVDGDEAKAFKVFKERGNRL